MKKRKTTFIMMLLLVATLRTVAQTTPPDATGMDIDARQWTRDVKMGWNLGNALESAGATWDDATGTWKNPWLTDYNQWETGWGNPKTTQQMIKAVREAGFDAIRVPVRWVPHITDYTTMTVDPVWMARVKEVVDWCLDEGLTVVINTHHELWLESHPFYSQQAELLRRLKALWTNIATTFRDYDSRLAFSGTNEVTVSWAAPSAENLAVQNSYNQAFVDAVRATGGKNYYRQLIVQTYATDPGYGLAGFQLPDDVVEDRLSVEFHYYSPYSYCSGTDGCYYYWGEAFADKGTVTPDGNERALHNLFTQIRKAWYERGLGVVLGEYGVSRHYSDAAHRDDQDANARYYLKSVVSEARKNGFAAFVWDNNVFGNGSETFGIFNRNHSMRIDTPHDMPTHLLSDPQRWITKTGRFLRKTSLDELPQIAQIFTGKMSIIGPRPALWNQYDLIAQRDKYGANDVRPGLSGWAQINGRDELPIEVKARYDGEYVERMSFLFDCKCFFGTIGKVLKHEGVVEGGTGELEKREKETAGK